MAEVASSDATSVHIMFLSGIRTQIVKTVKKTICYIILFKGTNLGIACFLPFKILYLHLNY